MIAVSSTALGLTSLFEMGRGEHQSYQPHKVFALGYTQGITWHYFLWYKDSFNIVKDVEE